MNLILFGFIHPYKAFCNANNEHFAMTIIGFLIGVGFLFFGSQEILEYISIRNQSQITTLIDNAPYLNNITLHKMTFLTLFSKVLIILFSSSFIFSIINYIYGSVFSNGEGLNFIGHLKATMAFFYGFYFYAILIDILLIFTKQQNFYFYAIAIVFIILMTLLYSAIYYTNIVKAFFNIIINLISISLLVCILYAVSLLFTNKSVEQELKDNFDLTIQSID
jgi:hypothetical protein